ncbi:MAG: hypothetical protein M1351_01995 [Candidatus Thermoplasmatota archaeon]|nr:hypothetical protein [Candidatus Thermoplasmatota archaeon]
MEKREETITPVRSKNVFVLIVFEDQFQATYLNEMKPEVEYIGYSSSKADKDLRDGSIIDQDN